MAHLKNDGRGRMIDDSTRLVEVYRARSLPDAHVVRLHLEDLAIPFLLENELLQGVVGELPFGWVTSPRILVPEENEAAAREALKDHVSGADVFVSTLASDGPPTSSETQCLACGGSLDQAGICTSCGWTFHTEGENEEPARELPSLWEVARRAVGGRPEIDR